MSVVPTISPKGDVLPLKKSALRFVTRVLDETVNGAVPDATVEVNRFAETLPFTVSFSLTPIEVPIPTSPKRYTVLAIPAEPV